MTGKPLDKARVQAATTEAIDGFYTLFESVKRDFDVLPENIWNMDEHGLALGICTNQRVIGVSNKSFTYPETLRIANGYQLLKQLVWTVVKLALS